MASGQQLCEVKSAMYFSKGWKIERNRQRNIAHEDDDVLGYVLLYHMNINKFSLLAVNLLRVIDYIKAEIKGEAHSSLSSVILEG